MSAVCWCWLLSIRTKLPPLLALDCSIVQAAVLIAWTVARAFLFHCFVWWIMFAGIVLTVYKPADVFCSVSACTECTAVCWVCTAVSQLCVFCWRAAVVHKPALGCSLLIVCVVCSLEWEVGYFVQVSVCLAGFAACSSAHGVMKLKQTLCCRSASDDVFAPWSMWTISGRSQEQVAGVSCWIYVIFQEWNFFVKLTVQNSFTLFANMQDSSAHTTDMSCTFTTVLSFLYLIMKKGPLGNQSLVNEINMWHASLTLLASYHYTVWSGCVMLWFAIWVWNLRLLPTL